jgi:lysophospholipase L1-like esterase
MRRRLSILTVLVMVLAVMPVSASADPPTGVYISLGDSLAAGTQANEGVITDDSYTDVLFQRVADQLGLSTHVKLGCPGETSTTFLAGGCPAAAALGYTTGNQFGDALVEIAAAGADLRLITIDIGANDVLRCLSDLQGQPTLEACLAIVALPTLAANLTTILATLQAVAPGVPIVGMNYYNPLLAWVLDDANAPFPGLGLASQNLVLGLNNVLHLAYGGAFGGGAVTAVPVVDIAGAFHTFDATRNVKDVCRFTLMCERDGADLVMSDWDPDPGPQPDIHPTDMGYRQMAWAFMQTMETAGIV